MSVFRRIKKNNETSKAAAPDLRTPEGFKQVYDKYSNKMYKRCLLKTGNHALAGDIVQEVFENLWQRRDTLDIKGSVAHYLMKASQLRAIDHLRTQASHQKHDEYAYSEHCAHDRYTENEVSFNELQQQVNDLIDQLPGQCRNVYELRHQQGLTNKEIASRLLISEATVSYHLSKATAFLKEKLAPMYDNKSLVIIISFIISA
ncbi:MAG: RNA polymerase sigma-70 factor [Bacteroidota bacterium]